MGVFAALPRKPLFGLALAGCAGIFLADWLALHPLVFAGLLAVFGAALWRWPNAWMCRVWIAIAAGTLHALRVLHGTEAALARLVENRTLSAEATGVVWSEPLAFESSRGEPLAGFQLRIRSLQLGGKEYQRPVLVDVFWVGPAPAYGDVVRVRGEARSLEKPRNPGEFDTAEWQRRRGVAFQLDAWSKADCAVTAHGQGSGVGHFAINSRAWIKQRLAVGFSSPGETALIESMVLGLRGETPAEMKELFQRTGTLHLFAVSGLNVAMLAFIVVLLLKPLRIPRAAAFFVAMPVLVAYAIATGLGASCVRATVMAGFVLAAPLFHRPAVMLNSMGGAALAILAYDTNQLFLPGFQLSFVLVICIIAWSDPIGKRIEKWLQPDDFIPRSLWNRAQRGWMIFWRIACQATGVTLAAWLGSLLFMAGYFHLLSPVAIVANAFAVPIAFVVLALGLLALSVSWATPVLAIVNSANWLAAKILLFVVASFAKVPHGHMYVEWPRLSKKLLCEITVLDVREGAAIHLRAGGTDWMLDCGHARDYAPIVLPYLRSRGVDWLDGLILTHGDSGHTGGALELLNDFAPPWIADTPFADRSPTRRSLHAALAARGRGRRFPLRGDVYRLSGDAVLRVLYPPARLERATADDKALVCLVEAGGLRVLLASDAGFFTEEWLLANEPDLRADVLVKGWHAGDFSGTPDFLLKVNPSVVVNSHPEFGMTPDKFAQWAGPVAARGARIFAQQDCGAVKIELAEGRRIFVEPQR